MASGLPRWILIVVLLVCVVGMLVWARGPQHQHGQYVGAVGGRPGVSQGLVG